MLRSKTLWASAAAICGALGGYFTSELALGEMLQIVVTSLLAVFLRHGVQKSEDAADAANEAASSVVPVKKKTTG